MGTWTKDELDRIGTAEELELASLRQDGSLRKRVTIWVVRLGDDLFIRSINGRTSAWFQGTQVIHAGHIWAGGVEKDVRFEDADPSLNEPVSAAYKAKYHHYAARIVNTTLTPQARDTTLRLVPRHADR